LLGGIVLEPFSVALAMFVLILAQSTLLVVLATHLAVSASVREEGTKELPNLVTSLAATHVQRHTSTRRQSVSLHSFALSGDCPGETASPQRIGLPLKG
jgi:hypothetical protein